MSDLRVELAGLRLVNPLMNASGVLGNTASLLRRVANSGAGAVVSKSATLEPRAGHDNPTYVKLNCGVINSMGLPNPGYEAMADELRTLSDLQVPVIASMAPSTEREAKMMSEKLGEVADAIEVNLSCPHVKNLGHDVSSDPDLVKRIVRVVKKGCGKPAFVKLPPVRADCLSFVKELVHADGFVVSNTIRAMAIDVSAKRPVLSNKFGGMSGPPLHPVVVGLVYELYEKTGKPLIGAGGVADWEGAVELMLAGATAVQIGTALSEDLGVIGRIAAGMNVYLDSLGLSAKELVGLAHSG